MLIKFKKPDPRAGTVARMDSSRGQYFINIGAAEQVSENAPPDAPAPDGAAPDAASAPAPAPKVGKTKATK